MNIFNIFRGKKPANPKDVIDVNEEVKGKEPEYIDWNWENETGEGSVDNNLTRILDYALKNINNPWVVAKVEYCENGGLINTPYHNPNSDKIPYYNHIIYYTIRPKKFAQEYTEKLKKFKENHPEPEEELKPAFRSELEHILKPEPYYGERFMISLVKDRCAPWKAPIILKVSNHLKDGYSWSDNERFIGIETEHRFFDEALEHLRRIEQEKDRSYIPDLIQDIANDIL